MECPVYSAGFAALGRIRGSDATPGTLSTGIDSVSASGSSLVSDSPLASWTGGAMAAGFSVAGFTDARTVGGATAGTVRAGFATAGGIASRVTRGPAKGLFPAVFLENGRH